MYKKMVILLSLLCSTSSFATIDASAKANGATCKRGFYCELTGSHYINVHNNTDEHRDYHYIFSLCADNGDCVRQEKDFGIPPHQNYEAKWDSHVTTRFMVATTHSNYAQTMVNGAEKIFADNKAWVSIVS